MPSFGYIAGRYKNKSWGFAIESFYKIIGWPHLIRRTQARVIMNMLDLKLIDNVLDVGCGAGEFTLEISKKARFVLGFDISHSILIPAIRATQANTNLILYQGDIKNFPHPIKFFDKILVSGTLQSVDEAILMKECKRVLKNKGEIIFVVKADNTLIKNIYDWPNRPFLAGLKNFLRLPQNYDLYKTEYCHRTQMTRYYSLIELQKVAEKYGFEFCQAIFSPGKYASVLEDIVHMLAWRSGNFSFAKGLLYFLLAQPAYRFLDFLDRKHDQGNYMIAKLSIRK